MTSDSESSLSSSSDEAVTYLRKRKRKSIVYSDSESDSDIEIKPKCKRKPKPVYESDTEIAVSPAEIAVSPAEIVVSPAEIVSPTEIAVSPSESSKAMVFEENSSIGTNTSTNPSSRSEENHQVPCCMHLNCKQKKLSNDSSDSDEQLEKCPICLSKFLGQDVASPESCDHNFCLKCLQEWAKKMNTCPVDRLLFNLILVRHQPGGKITRRISVENKEIFDESDSSSSEIICCEVCGSSIDEDRLLLCDDCDQGYHCDCLNPPLTSVPHGHWYCPNCTSRRSHSHYLPSNLLPEFLAIINNRFRPRGFSVTDGVMANGAFAGNSHHRPSEASRQIATEVFPHYFRRVSRATSTHLTTQLHRHRQPTRRLRSSRYHSFEVLSNTSLDPLSRNEEQTESSSRAFQENGNRRQNEVFKVPDVCVRKGFVKCNSTSNSRAWIVGFPTAYTNEYEDSNSLFPFECEEERFGSRCEVGDLAVATYARTGCRNAAQMKRTHISASPLRFMAERSFPSLGFSSASSPSENCDILGNILETQTVLHSASDYVIQRDGSLSVKQFPVGQQRPLNPVQQSSSTSNASQRNVYYSGSSSSSSPVSGSSSFYDTHISGSTSVDNSGAGYGNNDSHSFVPSRDNCNFTTSDEYRRDTVGNSHSKETKNDHSDDEVDIYSDIESVGENETVVDDDDVDEPVKSYKCEDSQLSNIDNETDSSENELIIDEDVHVEEENDKVKNKCIGGDNCISRNFKQLHCCITPEGSEGGICSDAVDSSDDPHSVADDINVKDKSDSFDGLEENSHGSTSSYVKDLSQDELSCSNAPKNNLVHSHAETENDYTDVGNNSPEKEEENSLDSQRESSSDVDDKHSAKIAKITSVPSYLSQSACDHYEDRELSDSMVSVTSLRGGREKISDYEQPSSKAEGSEYIENVGKKMPSTCSKNLKNDDEMCASQEMRKFIVQGKDKYGLARTDINDEKNNFFNVEKELLNVKESNNLQVESFAKSSEFSNSANNIQSSNVCYQGNSEANAISKYWDQNKDGVLVHHSALVGGEPCAHGHSSNISILNMEGKDFHSDLPHVDHLGNDSAKNFHVSQNDYMDHSVIKEVGIQTGEKNLKSAATAFVKLDKNMKSNTRGSESGDNMSDSHDTDLGIEDISEAGSDELNKNELIGNETTEATFINFKESHIFNIEQNRSSLKQNNSHSIEIGSISCKNNEVTEDESPKKFIDKGGRYISELKHSIHHTEDDKEEGEIVDEVPVQTKINKHDQKLEYAHDDVEDYIDMTPRINIADLPRIPKIKRDKLKNNLPEEPPSEVKRTSVLGRVDLGTTDISWKRLSKHTRERSYRDGRPKDERLLYREREGRIKEKKGSEIGDRRNEEKHREQERRRDDAKKTDLDRNKDKCQNDRLRDRKNEKVKEVHEKCNKNKDWNYGTPEKRDRDKLHEKPHKEKDKHERDKDRHERERHERDKDRYGRDEERYDRDSEICRFDEDSRYEKIKHEKEKPRDKDRKHRHKDRKAESGTKERSQNKHKRSHSREHFSEKQKEREVRKVDDKLKIVVEHKELKKDKLDKHIDKKESKHDKKHREEGHRHHEHRKKDRAPSPYMQLAPIESKEIFAKGDSIIINVNFSRSSSRESVPSLEDSIGHYAREGKKSLCNDLPKADLLFIPDDIRGNKSKHSLIEKERNVLLETLGTKRPSTPPERVDRNSQVLSVGESYWQESDDIEIKSPPEDKSAGDKICTDDDNAVESSGAFDGDNFSDSEVEDLSENITTIKSEDNESVPINSAKINIENFAKDEEDFSIPRRRSPHSPPPQSPPSPPDNDSYDPCEPTRSPSSVESSPVPLPTLLCSSERPRPPPSPELPPLPPEPEPTESLIREDPRSHKHTIPCPPPEFSVLSSAANDITSQASPHTQSSVPAISLPNIRVPPPNFIPHSVNRTASTVPLQLVQSRTMNWSVADPPPMLYPSNQVQHVVRGSFMQSQIQTSGLPLPPSTQVASQMGSVTQPTNSHSNASQVRHSQISAHSALSSSSLPPNVPLSHFNISQLQIPNMNHPPPNVTPTASTQHSNIVVSIQNQSSSSLPLSVQGQTSRTVSVHNQLLNISSSIQSLPSILPSTPPTTVSSQTVSISSSISNQSHLPPPPPITLVSSQKFDKLTKHSPIDKTEVVDMDVDSPYSPGDSPSMDSAYDYSPPSSPLHRATDSGKDVFDNLLGTNKSLLNDKHNIEFSSKGMSHKVPCKSRLIEHQSSRNSFEKSSKKQKVDDRSESSKARHSVRLQLTDKGKTSSIIRKEQKISDKKEVLIKLDESQLKILDELPSSAVEMQVKEKFLKKLNRQERVVEEVKLSLKPYYTRREINKDEYKDVLRKSVPKICHNRSGEINPVKVKSLVEGYIKKIKYARKKAEKKTKSSRLS